MFPQTSARKGFRLPARRIRQRPRRILAFCLPATLIAGLLTVGWAMPASADPPTGGSAVVSETFAGGVVPDSAWTALQDACLTGAPAGSTPPDGAAKIPSCSARQQGPVPSIGTQPGYLQLTDNALLREGSILYDRPIPATSGASITFEQYQYGGSGADGIGFFLVDGSTDLSETGGRGGSLGYAPFVNEPGVTGGYLGIGLDAYGNYYNDAEGRGVGCPAGQRSPSSWSGPAAPNVITVRGPGDGSSGYCWLGATIPRPSPSPYAPGTTLNGGVGTLRAAAIGSAKRVVNIQVDPADQSDPRVIVRVKYSDTTGWVDEMNIPLPAGGPTTYKLGLSASTGYSTDVHLIRAVTVTTIRPLANLQLEKQVDRSNGPLPGVITAGTSIPYVYTVTNAGTSQVSNLTILDDRIASTDIDCERTVLDPAPAPTSTTTCTATNRVNSNDVQAGAIVNTAHAEGLVAGLSVESDERVVTVPLTSRLTLTKNVTSPGPYVIGQQVQYSYIVTNTGESDLLRVRVGDDRIPAASIGCPADSLSPGASLTCVASAIIEPADLNADGVLVNVARATGSTAIGQRIASDQVSRTIPVATDVAVAVDVDDSEPVVGASATFTITATNRGPVEATGVRIADSFPSDASDRRFVVNDVEASEGEYDRDGGLWSIPALGVGETATLRVIGTVGTGTTLTTSALVAAVDQYDREPANDRDQVVVNATVPTADIAVTTVADIDELTLGEIAIFTVRATNRGPFAASAVVVANGLPPALPYLPRQSSGDGSFDPDSGLWTIGELAVGETVSFNIALSADRLGTYRHIASLRPGSTPGDPNPANDSDSAVLKVDRDPADLSILKSASVTDAAAGQEASFDLVASNKGPGTAREVRVEDTLPPGFELTELTLIDGTGGQTPAPLPPAGAPIEWNVGTLTAGASAVLRVTGELTGTGTLVNSAVISSPLVDDPEPGNNAASATVRVGSARVNVGVAKSAVPDDGSPLSRVPVGETVSFTLTARHTGGTLPATGVTLLDSLPESLHFVSADGDGSYDPSSGVWTIGEIAPTQSASLIIRARVDEPGAAVNAVALRTMNEIDTDTADNVATATVVGSSDTDLTITKAPSSASVRLDAPFRWTVTVRNEGPIAAKDVVVADPGAVGVGNASPSSGGWDAESGRWSLPELAAGASATLTLDATAQEPGRIENTVGVLSFSAPDPDLSNNVATARVYVPAADIVVTKTADSSTTFVGEVTTFTVGVANAGPDDSGPVTVADMLADGWDLVSAEPSAGDYDDQSGVWVIPAGLEPAKLPLAEPQETLVITARATDEGLLRNTATSDRAASQVADPDLSNNAAAVSVRASRPPATLQTSKQVAHPTAAVGDLVTYKIGVRNTGPGAALGVVIVDEIPAALSDPATADDRCNVRDRVVRCVVGDVASAETATVIITARAGTEGTVVNSVVASTATDVTPDSSLQASVALIVSEAAGPSTPGEGVGENPSGGEGSDPAGGETIPRTGGNPQPGVVAMGIALLVLGLVLVVFRRRNERA